MLGIRLFWIALLVGLLILHFLRQLWSRRCYPSGPLPLPLMGGMWRTGIRLYQDTFIKQLKNPLEKGEQSVTPFLKDVTNKKDLVFSNGDIWEQQRVIGQATMQKLELEKKSVEHQIKEEAQQLVETFTHTKGQPCDPLLPITNSVCNMVCAVAFGHRCPMGDNSFQRLTQEIELALKSGGSFVYVLYKLLPWVMTCLPGPQKKALSSRKSALSFIKKEIKKHKECQSLREPQDFVDFYLVQIEKTKGCVSSTYDEEKLAECIFDLFITSAETTATSLQWGLLLMAIHPDIQDKVYQEMEGALGSSHSISYQDWKKLPYTCAVIHEIQRTKYAFLFRIIKQSAKDVNFLGCLMPKRTFINPNLNSILLDPKQWETPEKFNPSHFLDKSGKFVAKEEFQLFGSGDSVCLEEQLARAELFSFLTTLLRTFRFQLPGEEKKLNKETRTGLTTYPHSYKLCAVPHCRAS